tara:strand:+ start:37 stop:267 length:231 start_codon:yes stop_codon:yes gene_type:complete
MKFFLKPLFILLAFCAFVSCKKDDGGGCVNCTSDQTMTFEVCENSDGNATVNGENTNTSFEVYIDDLQAAGANCGG